MVYITVTFTYNVFFHALRRYPGPWYFAASRLPYCFMLTSGRAAHIIRRFHEKYGDVVRIAPNELSYTSPAAWRDIMGRRSTPTGENAKDPNFYGNFLFRTPDIVNSNKADHSRYRTAMADAFSIQAVSKDERIIQNYTDLLLEQLRKRCDDGRIPVDIVKWYNSTAFDIVGHLVFGESFNCLDSGEHHPWIQTTLRTLRAGTYLRIAGFFPTTAAFTAHLMPKKILDLKEKHFQLVQHRVEHHFVRRAGGHDLINRMKKKQVALEIDARRALYER